VQQLNIPNILSLTRVVLAFVFAILLFNSYKFTAAGIFLLAVLTDVADGYLARKYNQITVLGKMLDPAADRLLMLLTFLVLLFKHNLPLWLLIVAFSYHLLVIFGWVIVYETRGITINHTFFGKMNSFFQVLMFFAVIFNFYPKIFFWIVAFSMFISFTNYLIKGLKVIKTKAPS